MTGKKIQWFKNPKSLAEEYQSVDTQFALANASGEEVLICHEWVKCRDFLNDAIRATVQNKKSEIYGFKFDETNPKIDIESTTMAVTRQTLDSDDAVKKFCDEINNAILLLNHFESIASEELTTVNEIDATGSNRTKVFLFKSPKMWITSPHLISMYSLLIRLGSKNLEFEIGNETSLTKAFEKMIIDYSKAGDKDASYIKSCGSILHHTVKNYKSLFDSIEDGEFCGFHDMYLKESSIGEFHNHTGIVALANGLTPIEKLNNIFKELKKRG